MVLVLLNEPLEHGKEVQLTMLSLGHLKIRSKGSKRGQVGLHCLKLT